MSKITVTTIAGQTSGSDANKVKIESGDELNVVNGDLTVDTDTLFVDASADKVGINQASPTYQLSVLGATQSTVEIESASTTGESRLYMTDPDSTGVGEIGYYHNGDTMRFNTGGVERIRLSSAGLHIGGTGAANALDDYEEGTWTPTVQNATGYSSQFGRYFKVGHLCFLNANVTTTGASGSTNEIRGLPFTSASTGNSAGNLSIGYYSGVNTPMVWLSGYVINNSNIIYITGNAAGHTGETIQYNGTQMFKSSGNSRIMFSVVYHVA